MPTASAAPQVLALLSSDGEVTLRCEGGVCTADFSAFCLQQSRPAPTTGTPYQFADASQVRLIGRRADGSRIRLDASEELHLASQRDQLVVRLGMPERRLDALGLRSVAVEIGPNVTLLPDPVAGDPNPLSESEIALAAGPLRQAGSRVAETKGNRINSVRWLMRLSNQLPRSARLTARARGRFLDRARKADAPTDLAGLILDSCQASTDFGGYKSLRACFAAEHDAILWQLNTDYWRTVQTGS